MFRYIMGSVNSHARLVSYIAKAAKCPVLSVNYRLAPEERWPGQIIDALNAYVYVHQICGIPASRIAFAGDSAGGNLAVVSCLALILCSNPSLGGAQFENDPAIQTLASLFPNPLPLPASLILLSPWVNLDMLSDDVQPYSTWQSHSATDYLPTENMHRAVTYYLPLNHAPSLLRHPLVSPVFSPSSLLQHLPPILVSLGAKEQLYGEISWFVDSLRSSNVQVTFSEFPGMPHVFHAFGDFFPSSRTAIQECGDFFQSTLLTPILRSKL